MTELTQGRGDNGAGLPVQASESGTLTIPATGGTDSFTIAATDVGFATMTVEALVTATASSIEIDVTFSGLVEGDDGPPPGQGLIEFPFQNLVTGFADGPFAYSMDGSFSGGHPGFLGFQPTLNLPGLASCPPPTCSGTTSDPGTISVGLYANAASTGGLNAPEAVTGFLRVTLTAIPEPNIALLLGLGLAGLALRRRLPV